MSLPSLVKTYAYPVRNQAYAASGSGTLTDNRTLLLGLKNALLALAAPFQVRGSSDSSAASLLSVGSAGPGTDRWSTISNLVWANAASAHSWIVLRQTGVGSTYEVLISCENASAAGTALTVYVSPSAGFTGGTTTARPTATDEIALRSNATWGCFASGSAATIKANVVQSSDGAVTRCYFYCAGVCITWIGFEKPQNPVTGWSNPSASIWLGSDTSALAAQPTTGNLYTTANYQGRGAGTMAMYLTAEAANNSTVFSQVNRANDLSGLMPMGDVGLFSTTASNGGRHGKLFDLYWHVGAVANGDSVLSSSVRVWDAVGDLWLPSNGVALATS